MSLKLPLTCENFLSFCESCGVLELTGGPAPAVSPVVWLSRGVTGASGGSGTNAL